MTFDPPLSLLLARCETFCVAACCGIEAYDFSPIHIASFLVGPSGAPEPAQVAELREQLRDLRHRAEALVADGGTAVIDEMNHGFGGEELLQFADTLVANLDIALELVTAAAARRTDPLVKGP